MTKWELAHKLYAVGYTHEQVRSIWTYVHNEQVLPQSGKRKHPRWQAKALIEVQATVQEVIFSPGGGYISNYF